jgi:hypothetical protein
MPPLINIADYTTPTMQCPHPTHQLTMEECKIDGYTILKGTKNHLEAPDEWITRKMISTSSRLEREEGFALASPMATIFNEKHVTKCAYLVAS